MICECGDRHNDHAPEVSIKNPCLNCDCSEFRPQTEASRQQRDALMEQECSNDRRNGYAWEGDFRGLPHTLIKVSTRRPRDWFRKRVWWRCFWCSLEQEAVK